MNTQYNPGKEERLLYAIFTSDNEALAEKELTLMLESVRECKVISIDVVKSKRACRNVYGKEIGEDEFDSIEAESDEAWFDDYDMVFKVTIAMPVGLTDQGSYELFEQAGLNVLDGFEE